MELKQQITSKFNKENFNLTSYPHDGLQDGDTGVLDSYIRDFIIELNKSKHISTFASCEGHIEGEEAYLAFNVDGIGWDILFQKVIPELSYRFCYINPKLHKYALYQLDWFFNISDVGSTGISIHSLLKSFMTIGWEEKKEKFWSIIFDTFLKYYINDLRG